MNIGWIDSHAHLCEETYEQEIKEIIERAKENHVYRMMVIACNLSQGQRALQLKREYDVFDIAVGFHPEDADNITDEDLYQLEQMLQSGEFNALGEIGLDYYWRKDNKEKQIELFIKQIQLAQKYDLPILIHSRDAMQETYDILKQYPSYGIMHCFGGSVEMMREFVKLGYMISLAGPVTFKNAVVPKEVAKEVSLDHLLIETDCPYMTPHPYRGKRNEPMYVAYTGEMIASLKQMDTAEVQIQLQKNYNHLFHKKQKD